MAPGGAGLLEWERASMRSIGHLPLALTCAVLALGAASAQAAIPTGNLITPNPDAESAGAVTSSAEHVCPVGWYCDETDLTAVRYGVEDFPSLTEAVRIGGGSGFFAGGPDNAMSNATHLVDTSSFTDELKKRQVQFTLSGCLGGYGASADSAKVTVLDSVAAVASIGPSLPADRGGQTGLVPYKMSFQPPWDGTSRWLILLRMVRYAGSYNDGYADNLSLTAAPYPGPVAPAVSCQAAGAGALPSGGGGSSGGSGGSSTHDTAIVATLSGKRRQKLGRYVYVVVSCPFEPCSATARGRLGVPRVGTSRSFRLKPAARRIAKGARAKLKLRLSRKARRAAIRALRAHRKVKAKITVAVRDGAGNTTTKRRIIRLIRVLR